MKKYEILKNDYIEEYGVKLYRIRALRDFGNVKEGDIGGYIETEDNLSHHNDAWVYDNARVYENAWVYDNAEIYGNAEIYDNAEIYGNAEIQNGHINHRMVVNSKFDDLKFFAFTKARDITVLKVNSEWLFNIGCQNLITKEVFLKRIKSDGGVKKHPHRQDYLDILKLF